MKPTGKKSSTSTKATPAKSKPVAKAAAKTTVAKVVAAAPKAKVAVPTAPKPEPVKATPVAVKRAAKVKKPAAAPTVKQLSAPRPVAPPKVLPMPTVVAPLVVVPIKKDPRLATKWKTKPVEDLSDDEVIAMPDDEYMNDTQLAFFRMKLVQLKDDILANAGQTAENLRDDTVVVPDPADRATIEEEHALELRTRDRERKLLKKIEQSIARIDAGDYGYCDETGEPIGVPRLLARPTATLSLEAQQRRELKQKMFGD